MSSPDRGGRRDLAVVGLVWLALSVLGEVLVQLYAADSLPVVAAREGRVSDDAIVTLLRIVVPVFAFIAVVIVYAAIRFRVHADDPEDSDAQARDDRRFSWSWLGVTSALTVLVIFYPGITGLREIWEARDAPDPLVVEVTGSQWQWSFAYPAQELASSSELVLPLGRTVRFVLRSPDVIHGFWVPAFRVKQDVVPGETRELYLTPDRLISTSTSPVARVQCAEFCGIGHADMRAPVRVVGAAAFEAWVKRQQASVRAAAG